MIPEVVTHMVSKCLIENIDFRFTVGLHAERLTGRHEQLEGDAFVAISENGRWIVTENRPYALSLEDRTFGYLRKQSIQQSNLESLLIR